MFTFLLVAPDEVAIRPGVNQNSSNQSENISAPPISQLVAKLFPKLKEDKVKPSLQPEVCETLKFFLLCLSFDALNCVTLLKFCYSVYF